MSDKDLICWALSDGRRGMENQALGLAEAVAASGGLSIDVKTANISGFRGRLPERLLASSITNPLRHLSSDSDSLASPWPDLVIGCGRNAVGLSLAIKRAGVKTGKNVVTVQTQDPRVPAKLFDLVVPPFHDELTGPCVEGILGAPHRVTPDRLSEEARIWKASVANLPSPLVAVLIGGASRAYEMTGEATQLLCDQLLALRGTLDCGLVITASRRTGPANEKILRTRLRGTGIWFWDGTSENPYFGMLALADHILVTSDSTNMVTEAASTGKPVHVIHLPGGNEKFTRFHRSMETRGLTRTFRGALESWTYEPLNEAARIAPRIRAMLGLDSAAETGGERQTRAEPVENGQAP